VRRPGRGHSHALIRFTNAKICNGELTAGGQDQLVSITFPAGQGVLLAIVANMVQIVGDVAGEGDEAKIEMSVATKMGTTCRGYGIQCPRRCCAGSRDCGTHPQHLQLSGSRQQHWCSSRPM